MKKKSKKKSNSKKKRAIERSVTPKRRTVKEIANPKLSAQTRKSRIADKADRRRYRDEMRGVRASPEYIKSI